MPPYVSVGYVPSDGPSYGNYYAPAYGPSYRASYGHNYTPYGSRYQPAYLSPNYGFIAPQPQGTPHYNTQPYMVLNF